MRSRFFLADNPGAGYGSRRLVDEVVAGLQSRGATVDRVCAGDSAVAEAAMRKAADAGACDSVLAAGGDGTIRLAAKSVYGTGIPVGIIPLGTGNVLAHEVGLPTTADAIVSLLVDGETRNVQAARANGELFLLMAGVGFDGHIIAALDTRLKQRIGKLAYVAPTLKALTTSPDMLEVRIDDQPPVSATWVVVANACRYAGRFAMAPRTGIEQPGLQAVLFSGQRGERLAQLLTLARGRLGEAATVAGGTVAMRACRKVTVTAPRPAPVQLDGDPFGTTPLVVEIEAAPIPLILPPRR